jgi:hypothetical protein
VRTLVINRHALSWATGPRGSYLPAAPAERHLLTRTFGGGLDGYEGSSFPYVSVLDMDDVDRTEAVARWMIETHGIERIVALHEKDLMLAARLRERFGLAGMPVATTLRFRDKLLMKDTLAGAGYDALPRYRAVSRGEVLTSVPWNGRSVVKSRWGVGSSQVRIVDDLAAANRAARDLEAGADGLEIEAYVDGTMFHCDSVVHDGRIVFSAVSEYLAQPGRYRAGATAGSVLVAAGPEADLVIRHNRRVLRILGMTSGVTHAEFFLRPSGEIVFCEVAARPGGGGIDDIVRRGYGVDLVRAAVELQSGRVPAVLPDGGPPAAVFGVVGVYHTETGADRPVPELRDVIPEVLSYSFARQQVAGPVRHCTDYAHKVVIGAETRQGFDRAATAVVRRFRREQGTATATRGASGAATDR